MGLAIGAFNARVLAPSLLVLGLAMCGVYALLSPWHRLCSLSSTATPGPE